MRRQSELDRVDRIVKWHLWVALIFATALAVSLFAAFVQVVYWMVG